MSYSPQSISVLVADDDPVFCKMMEVLLEQNGVGEIKIASNGDEVRRFIASGGKANVLTLDINMPDYDGIEVIALLARAKYEGTVILISGAEEAVIEAATTYAEVTLERKPVVFRKPVNFGEVIACILGNGASVR